MNYKDYVVKRLKSFKREDVIISYHAMIRLAQRQISDEEIIENVINPKRLEYAIKEKSAAPDEEKFDCYFGYSKSRCHRYVLVIKDKIIIITAVKIDRRWQKIAEKKLRSENIR